MGFGQWRKDVFQIIIDLVACHLLRNNPSIVDQGNDDAIPDSVFKPVRMTDLLAEFQIGIALILSQNRGSRESDLEGVRKHLVHHIVELAGM